MAAPEWTQATLEAKFDASYGYGMPKDLIDIIQAPCELIDRIPIVFNNQPVEAPELLVQAEGADDGSFQEGYCPTGVTHANHQFPYTAKSFGRCSDVITDAALAAKQHIEYASRTIHTKDGPVTIKTQAEYTLYVVLRSARKVLEYLIMRGDASVNADNFDGIDRIIRDPAAGRLDLNGVGVTQANSIVTNQNGALTVQALYDMVFQLINNGVDPGDIFIVGRRSMLNEVARLVSRGYFNPEAERERFLANGFFPLVGNNIPFVTCEHAPVSGGPTEWTGNLYFLTTEYYGVPSLWVSYFDFSGIVQNAAFFGQAAPSPWVFIKKTLSSDLCTSQAFCIWAHGKLVSGAPQSLGAIRNITYTFSKELAISP